MLDDPEYFAYPDDSDEDWRLQMVTVDEPLAALFRMSRCRRYDLVATMAKELRFPRGGLSDASEDMLFGLYKVLVRQWADHDLRRKTAAVYLDEAMTLQDGDELEAVARDLRLTSSLWFNTTVDGYDDQLRKALAGKLRVRVEQLIARAVRAAREASAA